MYLPLVESKGQMMSQHRAGAIVLNPRGMQGKALAHRADPQGRALPEIRGGLQEQVRAPRGPSAKGWGEIWGTGVGSWSLDFISNQQMFVWGSL